MGRDWVVRGRRRRRKRRVEGVVLDILGVGNLVWVFLG